MPLQGVQARTIAIVAGALSAALAAAWYGGYVRGPAPGAPEPPPQPTAQDTAPASGRIPALRAGPAAAGAARKPGATGKLVAAQLSADQRVQADAIAAALSNGPTLAACRAAEAALLSFARSVPARSSAWNWALDRATECLRAPHAFRTDNALLKGLLEAFPDDPRVRTLAALQSYDAGRFDEAAAQLEEALEDEEGTFEAWESFADLQLSRALAMRSRGEPGWEEVLMQAEAAAMRALSLADEQSRPLALHTVARTQMELGRPAEAIQWADQAVAALQAAGSSYQAVMAAELYVFSGQIYFRSGQRDTGLAYMDQGIAMAASAQQQAQLRHIREEFLRRYGG